MKLKNASAAFALLGVSALVLTGCAAAPEAEPTASETASEAPSVDYLACAVSDEGSWNDKSFNESVYTGLMQAKTQLGVETIADRIGTPLQLSSPILGQQGGFRAALYLGRRA